MSANSRRSTKEIILLSLSTLIICGSFAYGFSVLWKECSRLLTNPVIYPSSWRVMN
jgi:hypothetical protein